MSDITYQPRDGFIANLREGPRTFPAFYYFPGTGPENQTCSGCAFFRSASHKGRGRCLKWILHRGLADQLEERTNTSQSRRWLVSMDGPRAPCIDAETPSCKYWQETRGRRVMPRADAGRAVTFAAIVADVDRTIAHWRARGVTSVDIGAQLLCRRSWPNIRRRMVLLVLPLRLRVYETEVSDLVSRRMDFGDRRATALRLAA